MLCAGLILNNKCLTHHTHTRTHAQSFFKCSITPLQENPKISLNKILPNGTLFMEQVGHWTFSNHRPNAALNFSSDVKVGSLKRKLGSVFSYFRSGLSERRLSDARNGQGSMPDLSRLPLRISKLFPVLWKNESSLSMISLKTSSITLKLKDVRFSCEPLFQYKKKK